jgi:hypothetical protein
MATDDEIAAAERDVLEAEERVQQQIQVIVELTARGHKPEKANEALTELLRTLNSRRRHLARLLGQH